MNGNEFLARCRQEREQDNNSVGGLWGRQEEEVLAPLDRPNRDPPARTSLNRRAQHEAAARASAAAAAAAAAADDDDALAGGRDNDAISFWPDIRRRLRAEADLHNFIAECAICAESTREMMVLNCGHMMCRPCLDSVRTNMDSDDDPFHIQQRGGNPKACTMCRQSRIKQGMDILFAVLLNCDERDKKLIQVPPGMTLETAEERLDDDFDPVPEVQHLMESINKLAMDPDFAKRYTGVFPQTQSLNAYVAVRKRGQTRER
ncbi:hypothetical protein F5X68DRAFT_227813 [Plectosphaerella plurivora]|uniref:RING-type domain-containing protein n=1 Tax=Plectosphaerella plurivora TaxID=936078 RepID=A0A9P8VJN0_9PEZI|nr:hypothetical protein F5X68DRAFT_227813 [Plectosphaerella plurivora]